jgi:23S rRNA (guanosine2251-2'-O)-methyltransferase
MPVLAGIHPVREALRAARPLERVLIAKGAAGPRVQEIIELCRRQSVPVRFELREALDRAATAATHQGVVAFAASHAYATLEEIEGAAMLVVLDGVEDPHNLGAIIRCAHAAGAGGILLPQRRSAPLSETVAKAAAGALEHLRIARIGNITQTLERLKKRGYWLYGLDERGDQTYHRIDYTEPAALVVGGEGKGLHEHVKRHCDFLVRIPVAGPISSLNVSVATAIVLFEWRRRKG